MKLPVLRERVLSAFVIVPVMLWAFYAGGWGFLLVIAIIATFTSMEYRKLLANVGVEIELIFVPVCVLVALSGYAGRPYFFVAALTGGALVLLSSSLKRGAPSAMYSVAGEMYLGGLLGTLCLLRVGPGGKQWTLFILFVTWATDVGAYFGGRVFGHHKLAPSISPGKSWEGAISGFCAGVAVAGFVGRLWGFAPVFSLLAGAILAILAEVGDLVESVLKRHCNVKDSGKVIPGHGGFLDRFDSLLFTSAGGLLIRSIHRMLFYS